MNMEKFETECKLNSNSTFGSSETENCDILTQIAFYDMNNSHNSFLFLCEKCNLSQQVTCHPLIIRRLRWLIPPSLYDMMYPPHGERTNNRRNSTFLSNCLMLRGNLEQNFIISMLKQLHCIHCCLSISLMWVMLFSIALFHCKHAGIQ